MAAAFLVREKEISLREDALFCFDAVGQIFKLQFIGELENAKCKMQNAKLMKPFADAKACLVVKVRE